jgi:N-acetyl sugar amidotransferase
MQEYRICSQCVMDTSDQEITFDSDGVCNHCTEFKEVTSKAWYPNEDGKQKLEMFISKIKHEGKNNDYDCIIGLSGGVDSSYLALIAKDWGLRPLVVHVDAGWNSELAVANIEKIVKHCNYHLHTHVVDWSEMRDLHLAYLRAGIANQDVVQDHIFFSSLYHFATQNGIRYILSGGNIATEGIFPSSWHGSAMDAINLNAIHKIYGKKKLRHYKTISFFQYYIWYPFVKKMRTFRPLNFMPYNKSQAISELENKIGWRNYGRKHGESLFTKFFQNHYLPQKFGFDKRRPHLSSLIITDQITRVEAIEMLKIPLYDIQELEKDIQFLCKKLNISREEYDEIMKAPIHDYTDFPNWNKLQNLIKKGSRYFNKLFGKKITVYS